MLYGVDIHARYQESINLATLKQQGYAFMVTKASEGTYIPSGGDMSSSEFKAHFMSWIAQARDLGMVPGLYHWLKKGNGVGQAQFFHGLVVEAGGPAGLLIQLDCEDNATYEDVKAWAKEWDRLTGGHPFTLYTGKWWWGPKGWDGYAITPYLWESHYIKDDGNAAQDNPAAIYAQVPASWWTPGYGNWPRATVLQFTSQGDAGGLTNNVDLNAFEGTMSQLWALANGKGDHDMWCRQGDEDGPDGNNVHALQADLTDAGADLSGVGGIDGEYGPGTAAALVDRIGAEVAGDGSVYGWAQRRALRKLVRANETGGPTPGLPAHTHTFDPAASESGPAVPTR